MNHLDEAAIETINAFSTGRQSDGEAAIRRFVGWLESNLSLVQSAQYFNQIGSVLLVCEQNNLLTQEAVPLAYWCFCEQIMKNEHVRLARDNRLDLLEDYHETMKQFCLPLFRSEPFYRPKNILEFTYAEDELMIMEFSDFQTGDYDLLDAKRALRLNHIRQKISAGQFCSKDENVLAERGSTSHELMRGFLNPFN